jgi:methyl-accepting chemotaxis protein
LAGFKRSIFIINPKFQFKFSLIVCSLILLSSLLYPITIYEVFEAIFRQNPALGDRMGDSRSQLLGMLAIIQVVYIAIVFIICIFISHKIAGPMFKLGSFFKNIADGNKPKELYFRNGDNFMEIADLYNQAMNRIKQDRDDNLAYLADVKSYINNLAVVVPEDKKPVIKEITHKLDEIINQYE